MKSFKQFVNEETMPYAGTSNGVIDVRDSAVRDNINKLLAGATNGKFLTPYIAFERVCKALANFHIFPPRTTFFEGDSGAVNFAINQFGFKMGMTNDGKVVTGEEDPHHIYFEYRMSDCGMFEIFCEIVDQSELEEILSDLEDEMSGETENIEELDEDTEWKKDSADVKASTDKKFVSKMIDKWGERGGAFLSHPSITGSDKREKKTVKEEAIDEATDPRDSRPQTYRPNDTTPYSRDRLATRMTSDPKDSKARKAGKLLGLKSSIKDALGKHGPKGHLPEEAIDEVVTTRKMTAKEKKAQAQYLVKHKEKLAANDTGIKAKKNFSDYNSQIGNIGHEPSKMKMMPVNSARYFTTKMSEESMEEKKEKKKAKFKAYRDERDDSKKKREDMKWQKHRLTKEEVMNEISAKLVGKVNKARAVGGKPSKTPVADATRTRAVVKKWLDSDVGKLKE